MARSRSSKRWLQEHETDRFVQQSRKDGYRSRASYKLLAIHDRDRLFKPGMTVVDLGAAPGGWSQVAAEKVGAGGRVVASDILPMDRIAGVEFICGDFTESAVFEQLLGAMNGTGADLVISDMAPNMSGIRSVDQPAAMYLVELAVDLSERILKPRGAFVAKVFHGEGFDQLIRNLRSSYDSVVVRKPDASRSRSREVYVVARGYRH